MLTVNILVHYVLPSYFAYCKNKNKYAKAWRILCMIVLTIDIANVGDYPPTTLTEINTIFKSTQCRAANNIMKLRSFFVTCFMQVLLIRQILKLVTYDDSG